MTVRVSSPVRLVLLSAVLAGATLTPVTGLPPAPESNLLGRWQSADGRTVIDLTASRFAQMEIATVNPEKPDAEPKRDLRLGEFSIRRGGWILSVRDIDRHVHHYGVIAYDANRLGLMSPDGRILHLQRYKPPRLPVRDWIK